VSLSVKTIRDRATWLLFAKYIYLDAINAIDLIVAIFIKKKHSVVKKMPNPFHQSLLLKTVSLICYNLKILEWIKEKEPCIGWYKRTQKRTLYMIVYLIYLDWWSVLLLWLAVRHGSHQGGSPQNRLGDKRTCGITLASAYVLHCLSAAWLQLQMKGGKSEWMWVLISMSLLNTGGRVQ